MNKLLFASTFALFLLMLLPNVSAVAELDGEPESSEDFESKKKELPFGPTVVTSIVIVVTGVMVYTTLGYFKAKDSYNTELVEYNKLDNIVRVNYEKEIAEYNKLDNVEKKETPEPVDPTPKNPAPKNPGYDRGKLARSFLLAPFSGLIVVLPQVQTMSESFTIDNLILGLTLIAAIAGIDAVAKKAGLGKKTA